MSDYLKNKIEDARKAERLSSSSGSATALERATAQFEALRNAYRGYMPWGSENADVKTRLLQIEDMDKAFFAAMAMLSVAQAPSIQNGADYLFNQLEKLGAHVTYTACKVLVSKLYALPSTPDVAAQRAQEPVKKGDILTYELTENGGLGRVISHTRECEICRQRPGKHDAGFDGFACDECKSQWTETVVADDTPSVSSTSRVRPEAAIENLNRHQVQCDETGEMIQVSRQALDEILAYLAHTSTESQ